MFEEDLFKDAKYCVPCNKFYVTDHCPFCTPKKTTPSMPTASVTPPTYNDNTELNINNVQPPVSIKEPYEYKKSNLDSKVEGLSLEIERLRRENKEKKEQIAKAKELEFRFNILADKFDRLSQLTQKIGESANRSDGKEKEHREQTFQEPSITHWPGRDDIKTKSVKDDGVHPTVHDNGRDVQTKLLKERIKELNAELERLQQKSEEKDQHVLKSIAEASKLTGVTEQQKDELERLRFDIQERDRVIMQISLTLSSAISQALAQRGQEKLQELTTPHSDPSALGGSASGLVHKAEGFRSGSTIKRNKRSRKTLYTVLGGLNAAIIGYIGYAFLYKKGIVTFIIEFFTNLF